MKRYLLSVSLVTLCLLSLPLLASAESKHTNFSGTWTLDRGRSPDVPLQLDSYTMKVTQNAIQLEVATTVEMKDPDDSSSAGATPRTNDGGYPGRNGGSYPRRTGVSFPGTGGVGFPGSGRYPSGGDYPGGGNYPPGGDGPRSSTKQSGTRALRTYLPTASYSLDGAETTTEVKGRMPGKATFKAAWKKGGKVLSLSTVQNLDSGGSSTVAVKSAETWEFSKDGKNLMIERTVKTPRGSDTIKLAFRKDDAAESKSKD